MDHLPISSSSSSIPPTHSSGLSQYPSASASAAASSSAAASAAMSQTYYGPASPSSLNGRASLPDHEGGVFNGDSNEVLDSNAPSSSSISRPTYSYGSSSSNSRSSQRSWHKAIAIITAVAGTIITGMALLSSWPVALTASAGSVLLAFSLQALYLMDRIDHRIGHR